MPRNKTIHTTPKPAIVWFRNDLRLADNPALSEAVRSGALVIPVYIWAPQDEADWAPGAASRWWLHHSLIALDTNLRRLGSRLVLRSGSAARALHELITETGAGVVFWNRLYEPVARERDASIDQLLKSCGVEARTFNGTLLREPSGVQNSSGKPFQVFTAFWKHCLSLNAPAEPLSAPESIPAPKSWPKSLRPAELELEPKRDWASGLRASWSPGEAGASRRLDCFLSDALDDYDLDRNRPDLTGTSRLSPHLHFGEISVRQIWHGIERALGLQARLRLPLCLRDCAFVTELGWREFSHHLLYHFPQTLSQPLREEFARFRWRVSPESLRAWQRGLTGYPLVDAGMRELWATGWMHNRVRMVVASFLVKDLLVSWQEGARWFWDTLVDADLAQNTFNWQWCAGCGADAAPFFRIFNPIKQGEKFDPKGCYIRRWVPELAALPDEWIHRPHQASAEALARADIELDRTYPRPIVNHAIAREVALEAYGKLRQGRAGRGT